MQYPCDTQTHTLHSKLQVLHNRPGPGTPSGASHAPHPTPQTQDHLPSMPPLNGARPHDASTRAPAARAVWPPQQRRRASIARQRSRCSGGAPPGPSSHPHPVPVRGRADVTRRSRNGSSSSAALWGALWGPTRKTPSTGYTRTDNLMMLLLRTGRMVCRAVPCCAPGVKQ